MKDSHKNYLVGSLPTLAVIAVINLAVFLFYTFYLSTQYFEIRGYATNAPFGDLQWTVFVKYVYLIGGFGFSMFLNALLVWFIPAMTPISIETKRTQYIFGFVFNIILGIVFPLLVYIPYAINIPSFLFLFLIYILVYPVTFIVSSLFVSPIYNAAFRF